MSIAERFMLLPPAIDYAGFTFRLQFTEHSQYGIGIAFVLTGCHSRKKYKRLAWEQGYWEDKSPQRQISTMFSNYLFYEPLFDTSDTSLSQALQNLHQRLIEYFQVRLCGIGNAKGVYAQGITPGTGVGQRRNLAEVIRGHGRYHAVGDPGQHGARMNGRGVARKFCRIKMAMRIYPESHGKRKAG